MLSYLKCFFDVCVRNIAIILVEILLDFAVWKVNFFNLYHFKGI